MSGFHGLNSTPVAFIDLGSPEDQTEDFNHELYGGSDPIRAFIDLSSPERLEEVLTEEKSIFDEVLIEKKIMFDEVLTEEKIMFDELLDEYSSPEVTQPFTPSTSTQVEYPTPTPTPILPSEGSPVEITHPPPLELRHIWMADAANVLPHDILHRAPRRRGKSKWQSMEYEPCTREEFIARVNQRYKAPVAKRQRRQIVEAEGTKDPVAVALLAQAEIYGGSSYFNWT